MLLDSSAVKPNPDETNPSPGPNPPGPTPPENNDPNHDLSKARIKIEKEV